MWAAWIQGYALENRITPAGPLPLRKISLSVSNKGNNKMRPFKSTPSDTVNTFSWRRHRSWRNRGSDRCLPSFRAPPLRPSAALCDDFVSFIRSGTQPWESALLPPKWLVVIQVTHATSLTWLQRGNHAPPLSILSLPNFPMFIKFFKPADAWRAHSLGWYSAYCEFWVHHLLTRYSWKSFLKSETKKNK